MNENQQAAYVISQSVVVYAEIEGMKALNQYRLQRGETIAYDDEAFMKVIEDSPISHNAVIGLFQGVT